MKVKLSDLGEISTGNTPSKKELIYWNSNDAPFVKPDDLQDVMITDVMEAHEYISNCGKEKARIANKDSILVTCIGSIGKVGIACTEVAFNQQINAIKPNIGFSSKYIAYAICANKRKLQAIANAPVVPIINKTQFCNFELNVDIKKEKQIQITRKLDCLSDLINKYKVEIQKMDLLVRARFIEMFGDPVLNSNELPEATLPDLGEFGRGVSKHRPRNDPKLLGGDYPLIQTGDVANADLYISAYNTTYSELGLRQSKMWDKGTLCITIAANIAKTAILESAVLSFCYLGYLFS